MLRTSGVQECLYMKNRRDAASMGSNPIISRLVSGIMLLACITGNKSCRNLDTIMRKRCTSPKHLFAALGTERCLCYNDIVI